MKYKLLIILLLLSSASFSQNFAMRGLWKGEVHESDTTIYIEMDMMVQNNTMIGAVVHHPTWCQLTDSSFYGTDVHLISSKEQLSRRNARSTGNNLKGEKLTLYHEIKFSGALAANKNQLSGELTLNGKVYPLDMFRGDSVIYRPQEPQKPYPYYSEDVTFFNKKDSVMIAGTLTLPNKEGKFPAVILKGGSLPGNRNGESNYHQSFLLIADYLTRNGIAVLRCDDRGIGRSKGNFWKSTPLDLAGDMVAGIGFLASRKEIKKNETGLIGHSEGGVVASIAAGQCEDIKFVVMLGAPGISLRQAFEAQTELLYKMGGISKERYDFYIKLNQKIYNMMSQNLKSKAMFDSLMIFKNEYTNIEGDSLPELSEKKIIKEISYVYMINSRISPHNLFNLNLIPSVYNEKLKCPVLSLNGSNDIFVPAAINQEAIRQALLKGGNKDYKILELDSLNHSFQLCKTGSIKESLTIEQTFSPHALDLMARWILEHVEK